jgi:hypothetical protein
MVPVTPTLDSAFIDSLIAVTGVMNAAKSAFCGVMGGLLLADCVEEVGDGDGPTRQTRAGSVVLKRASRQAAGSALPAFGGSGRWPPGGTRPEHQRGLSA